MSLYKISTRALCTRSVWDISAARSLRKLSIKKTLHKNSLTTNEHRATTRAIWHAQSAERAARASSKFWTRYSDEKVARAIAKFAPHHNMRAISEAQWREDCARGLGPRGHHFVRDFRQKRKLKELLCCKGRQKRRARMRPPRISTRPEPLP